MVDTVIFLKASALKATDVPMEPGTSRMPFCRMSRMAFAAVYCFAHPLLAVANDTRNVCEYVADAYNHGRKNDINSPSGIVIVEGVTVRYTVQEQGGSCGGPVVELTDTNDKVSDQIRSHLKFASQHSETGLMGITIVPFRGIYYTVSSHDNGPDQVVDPLKGPICNFARHYVSKLVENANPKLCTALLDGKLEHNMKWTDVDVDEIDSSNIQDLVYTDFAHFDRIADVDFVGNGHISRIGHFDIESSAGCGCDESGLALLKGNEMVDQNQEPNKSLIDSEGEVLDCGRSNADLIQTDGNVYVKAWGGKESASSALLQLTDNRFHSVCRIDQVLRVTPIAPVPMGSE